MTRAEKVAKIREYVEHGYTCADIATAMGLTYSGIRNLINDPDGSKQRARRLRYQGACEDCGAPTDGSNGRAKAPTHCNAHAPRHRPVYWTRDLLVARIREWVSIYGEPPAVTDWNPTHAEDLNDPARAARFDQANGYWPWFITVIRVFGSWNEGIESAGFTPRAPHGGEGNNLRRRNIKPREALRTAA